MTRAIRRDREGTPLSTWHTIGDRRAPSQLMRHDCRADTLHTDSQPSSLDSLASLLAKSQQLRYTVTIAVAAASAAELASR